jgi:hypothetical protein
MGVGHELHLVRFDRRVSGRDIRAASGVRRIEPLPYYDTDNVATIGIGFNIQEDFVLRAVMTAMNSQKMKFATSQTSATGSR